MKSIINEIHSCYVSVFCIVVVIGLIFSCIQKYTNVYNKNNNNNNIKSSLNLLDRKKGKFEFHNGIPISIGYGQPTNKNKPPKQTLFNRDEEASDTFSIFCICIIAIYATYVEVNRPPKNFTKTNIDV